MSRRPRKVHMVGPYIVGGRTLGVGTTGEVKMAFHRETGKKVALKIVAKDLLREEGEKRRQVEREIAAMKLLSHKHILDLVDVYETHDAIYLVEEYVSGGELFERLYEHGAPPADVALRYFQQIIDGVDCMHQHLVCHRDLKPESMLSSEKNKEKKRDPFLGKIRKRKNARPNEKKKN
jgi:BR serine/threonine kinase